MAKEQEEENRPPEGNDLMQVIYNVKPHQAYARRERNDQQLKLVMDKLAKGSTALKAAQEHKAIQEFVARKEVEDQKDEANRLKRLRNLELDMKKTLDRQMEEKAIAKKLQKYADGLEQT